MGSDSDRERDDPGSGGPAAAGGIRYQAQVTTWWMARILLQTPEVATEFDLPATAVAESVFCESTEAIDDVRIQLSDGSHVLGQCKRRIQKEKKPDSKFGKVFRQFIEEARSILSAQDERRFVLFSEKLSEPVESLGKILSRYRLSSQGTPLEDVARSKKDREIVADLNELLENLFNCPELKDMRDQRETILRHTYVKRLDVGGGGAHYLVGTVEALAYGLLVRPAEVSLAVKSLHEFSDELMANPGSADRERLRSRLQGVGIELRDSIDYRADFQKLVEWSNGQINVAQATGQKALQLPGGPLHITRRVVAAMHEALDNGSFLVVGEAGIGKTGCLIGLTEVLSSSGVRVCYCAANSAHKSIQQICNDIGLQHPWEAILAESASGNPLILIVDSLDGLRDAEASRAYKHLMALAMQRGLKVVASIRSFDLLHSHELKRDFKNNEGPLSESYYDETFKDIRHIAVLGLDDGELAEVEANSQSLKSVFATAPKLRDVCRNLFYLKLLSELLENRATIGGLTGIGSRAELFDRWWQHRIESHLLSQECLRTLRAVVERMVDQRVLRVRYDDWPTNIKQYLFSSEILRNPPVAPGRLPDEDRVEFCHHYLFDHAGMKLFVQPRRGDLAKELSGPTNWGLFLRPSLTLFFRHVWSIGRQDFWEFLAELERSSIMFFHKIPAYLVVASEAASVDDLNPLLATHLWSNQKGLIL
jgi:hypothetical protein